MRVSVSKVDSFLYYMRNDFKTLEEVRADILGTTEANEAMLMGSAFHEIFEHADAGMAADTVERNGFTFQFDADIEVPIGGVPEVQCSRSYEIDGQLVTVRGRADLLLGKKVTDFKMVPKIDESKYVQFQDSFQWRAYLDMLDADTFEYRLFLKKPKKGIVHITDMQTILFHRYPGMRHDIEHILRRFLAFTKEYVPEWWEAQVNHG